MKMLYNITKEMSGRLQTKDRPVRNRDRTLIRSIDEELKSCKEHFEEVLTCPDPLNPPDSIPGPDFQAPYRQYHKA